MARLVVFEIDLKLSLQIQEQFAFLKAGKLSGHL